MLDLPLALPIPKNSFEMPILCDIQIYISPWEIG